VPLVLVEVEGNARGLSLSDEDGVLVSVPEVGAIDVEHAAVSLVLIRAVSVLELDAETDDVTVELGEPVDVDEDDAPTDLVAVALTDGICDDESDNVPAGDNESDIDKLLDSDNDGHEVVATADGVVDDVADPGVDSELVSLRVAEDDDKNDGDPVPVIEDALVAVELSEVVLDALGDDSWLAAVDGVAKSVAEVDTEDDNDVVGEADGVTDDEKDTESEGVAVGVVDGNTKIGKGVKVIDTDNDR
jgi:hypothetical protein